jgi:hypothetical protein
MKKKQKENYKESMKQTVGLLKEQIKLTNS